MASIKQRGKSYQITVSMGYDGGGKKIMRTTTYTPEYLTVTGKPKSPQVIQKDVAAYAANWERQVKQGDILAGGKTKLEDFSAKFIKEYVTPELSPTTAMGYERIIKTRILPRFGHMKLDDISTLIVQSYYNDLYAEENLSAATIKRDITIFSSLMHRAVIWGLITKNPLDNVIPPRDLKDNEVKSFNLDQASAFLQALDLPYTSTYHAHQRTDDTGLTYHVNDYEETRYVSLQLKLFFTMALFSGARRGELIALNWSDIDFLNGFVNIKKNAVKVNKDIIIKEPKSKTSNRRVAICNDVLCLALQWQKEQCRLFDQLSIPWSEDSPVFTQINGNRMYPDTPTAAFRKIIKNYNQLQNDPDKKLPYISLHGLRHTSATLLIAENADIRSVSKMLGHAQTSTTLNIYAHSLEKKERENAEILKNILKS